MSQLIVTAVGVDRPGIVGEFSRILHEEGGNLADSRMVNLRGYFALLALIEVSADRMDAARARLAAQGEQAGLTLTFTKGDAPVAAAPGIPYRLRTYSADQPGIVHRVSEVLAKHRVNIEELETRLDSAPFSGTALFMIEARVTVPPGLEVRALRRELDALGAAIPCDIDLDPA